MSDFETKRCVIQTSLPFDCKMRTPNAAPREVILLLHGFAESGERMLTKLLPALPPDAVIVAPNGPFPMAYKMDKGWLVTFAWYFYDPRSDEYYVDMNTSLDFLVGGLKGLGLDHLPKRVIGFSQGGYLAPIVAQALGGVTQVVGIACESLVDEIPNLSQGVSYRVDGIHGSEDDAVPAAKAQESHRALASRGVRGEFILLEGSGHRIDDAMREALKSVLGR